MSKASKVPKEDEKQRYARKQQERRAAALAWLASFGAPVPEDPPQIEGDIETGWGFSTNPSHFYGEIYSVCRRFNVYWLGTTPAQLAASVARRDSGTRSGCVVYATREHAVQARARALWVDFAVRMLES